MSNQNPDADPQTPPDLNTALIAAHEYYTAARAAGFGRHEALYLTAAATAGGVKPPAED